MPKAWKSGTYSATPDRILDPGRPWLIHLAPGGEGSTTAAPESHTASSSVMTAAASPQPSPRSGSGGGVIEHPADSKAWDHFGLNRPNRERGWISADFYGGWTCYVEQGFYGHFARKPTWLLVYGVADLPQLRWGEGEQRLNPVILERHGYEYARRQGMVSMAGGKAKTDIREGTPKEFRDLLLSIAGAVKR